jgi:Putative zinc-finger
MTCHDARELFSALIDEQLTREERADLYGHLATCADCRRELAAVERTVALVRGAAPARAPLGFVDRVVAAARPTPWYVRAARAALLPWPVKLPLGAAALVLVAGLAVLMFRGTQEQQRAARPETAPSVLADRGAPPTSAEPERAAARSQDANAKAAEPAIPAAPSPAARRDAPTATARDEDAKKPAPAIAQSAPPGEARENTEAAKLESRRSAAPSAAPPEVVARLVAPDPATAERALAALAARLAGAQTGRRVDGDALVVELAIPRERYADFRREVARLGDYRAESEPSSLPDTVRLAVRVGS